MFEIFLGSSFIRPAFSACLAIACALVTPDRVWSQSALLVGRVLDFKTEAPIPGVRVDAVDGRGRQVGSTITDSAGAFHLPRIAKGSYQLRARTLGYRPVLTPFVDLDGNGPVEVIVRLAVDAIPIAPLEVTARPARLHRNVALSEFFQRAERRIGGTFIMREEIELRRPKEVTELLATAAGIMVLNNRLVNQRVQCAPTVYLDGVRLNHHGAKYDPGAPEGAFDAANLVRPSDLEGIEIYHGGATAPAEYTGSTAACGVILLWSKRG